ncbi:hypothetical protein QUF76_13300 [Desulfobacterales bacterium HSG16]|nr:hypothetical protein [Desulfobacterales bacterium HSG16]
MATWFISRLSTEGKDLQQRSAITFIEEAYEKYKDMPLSDTRTPLPISAVKLCSGALMEELLASENSGHRGAIAHSYMATEQRYKEDFIEDERSALLSVLISTKISLKPENRQDAHEAFSMIAGLRTGRIETAIQELQTNYNVLEWNDRFNRYEIIGDAVSRSAFTSFLRGHVNKVTAEQVEEIFTLNIKNWGNISNVVSDFATDNNIGTMEWGFQVECTNLAGLEKCDQDR